MKLTLVKKRQHLLWLSCLFEWYVPDCLRIQPGSMVSQSQSQESPFKYANTTGSRRDPTHRSKDLSNCKSLDNAWASRRVIARLQSHRQYHFTALPRTPIPNQIPHPVQPSLVWSSAPQLRPDWIPRNNLLPRRRHRRHCRISRWGTYNEMRVKTFCLLPERHRRQRILPLLSVLHIKMFGFIINVHNTWLTFPSHASCAFNSGPPKRMITLYEHITYASPLLFRSVCIASIRLYRGTETTHTSRNDSYMRKNVSVSTIQTEEDKMNRTD